MSTPVSRAWATVLATGGNAAKSTPTAMALGVTTCMIGTPVPSMVWVPKTKPSTTRTVSGTRKVKMKNTRERHHSRRV